MTIKLRCADASIDMFVVLLNSDGETTLKREPDGRLWQCVRFEFQGVRDRLYVGRWFAGQNDGWPKVIDMPTTTKHLRAILNSHQVPSEIEELASEWSRGGLTAWA